MNDFKRSLDAICKKNNAIGASMVVSNANDILESHCYGYQNTSQNELVNSKTIFRIASISKTIGAIALMQLVEQKKIDLNGDISLYLGYVVRNPNFPDVPITVKMLTLQTSSIQDGYDDENPEFDDVIKGYNGLNTTILDVSLQELLTNTSSVYYTDQTYGNYKPGTKWCYSNFGCGIMACIIEKVSGEFFVDYMTDHIFKPLGLNASFKASFLKEQENIACMYSKNSTELKTFPKERFINSKLPRFALGDNYRGPAGGLFISMEDLSILMRVFLNYGTYHNIRILRRETVELMYQMHWSGKLKDNYRAKGIQMKILHTIPSYPLRGHTGGAYGVRSYMFFSLKYNIGACFITNGLDISNESEHAQSIFLETQKLFLEQYATKRPYLIIIKKSMTAKPHEIHLEERKIKDHNLFLNDYMKATSLCDLLDVVGNVDEDQLNLTLSFNNKTATIEDVIIYQDNLYIHLEKTLKLFSIQYQKISDTEYQIYN